MRILFAAEARVFFSCSLVPFFVATNVVIFFSVMRGHAGTLYVFTRVGKR